MKELHCKIVRAIERPIRCFDYEVYDGEEVVAVGTSSSPDWVKHDAGGYHTKHKFDARYPEGWRVDFNF